MNVTTQTAPQLLAKPPRLLQSGQGYDWKEFDRWLQKIYVILGAPQNNEIVNITNIDTTTTSSDSGTSVEDAFTIDSSFEIHILRQALEQLTTEINMLQDQQQAIINTNKRIDDVYVELGAM